MTEPERRALWKEFMKTASTLKQEIKVDKHTLYQCFVSVETALVAAYPGVVATMPAAAVTNLTTPQKKAIVRLIARNL